MEMLGPAIGAVFFLAACVVALSNRDVRKERIELLEGQARDLRSELADERATCTRKVDDLSTRVSHLQGQLDAVTGGLGDRIGQRVAEAVIERLAGP